LTGCHTEGNRNVTDQVLLRPATPADAGAIAALHTASWRITYRGMMPDAYLDGPIAAERTDLWSARFSPPGLDRRFVCLAQEGGTHAGFVCALLDEEPTWGACLDNLHVLPAWRGRGLGRQLFRLAVEWVQAMEPGWPIYLWVFTANGEARKLYDALGGQIVEQHAKEVLVGITVPSLRYVWYDLSRLVASLGAGAARPEAGPSSWPPER